MNENYLIIELMDLQPLESDIFAFFFTLDLQHILKLGPFKKLRRFSTEFFKKSIHLKNSPTAEFLWETNKGVSITLIRKLFPDGYNMNIIATIHISFREGIGIFKSKNSHKLNYPNNIIENK